MRSLLLFYAEIAGLVAVILLTTLAVSRVWSLIAGACH